MSAHHVLPVREASRNVPVPQALDQRCTVQEPKHGPRRPDFTLESHLEHDNSQAVV